MLANVMEDIQVAIKSQPNLPDLAEADLNLARDEDVILRGVLPPREVRRAAALCDAAFTGLTTASDPGAYASAAAWGGMSLDQMLGCMADPEALHAIRRPPHRLAAAPCYSVRFPSSGAGSSTAPACHGTLTPKRPTPSSSPCVNFWVPFAPVGDGRSPTLEFVLGSGPTMRSCPRRISGETFRFDEWVQMRLGTVGESCLSSSRATSCCSTITRCTGQNGCQGVTRYRGSRPRFTSSAEITRAIISGIGGK